MKKCFSIVLILAALAGLLSGCGNRNVRTLLGQPAKIALVLRDGSGADGLALEAGAKRAGAELEVQVVNLSPQEQDSSRQAEQVRQAVAEGCDAIIVSYQNSVEVNQALQEAVQAGVVLVYADTAQGDADRVIYGTDHYAAGLQAAQAMLETLEAKRIRTGTIGIIGVNQRDAAALQRESGFRDGLDGKPFAIAATRYDGKNPIRAQNITADYINGNDVVGIFASSELSTVSAGETVRAMDDDAIVMGLGQSRQLQELLDGGYVRASLIQNYDAMGYGAVKAAVSILEGEEVVLELTDTGVKRLESSAPLLRPRDLRLALITTDQNRKYWDDLEEGVRKAAGDLGCKVVNMSPDLRNEVDQAEHIQQAIEDGYYGIIAASNDSDAVDAALKEASDAGLTVICVDTSFHEEAHAVVSEDHRETGRMAARAILEAMKAKEKETGEIGIIGVSEDEKNALQREEGFREVFEGTSYEILDTRYGDGDAGRSHSMATKLLEDGADALFGCSEGAAIGAANAVREANRKTVVVGYGRAERVSYLLEEELAYAVVVPHPDVIGAHAVKTACAMILGEPLPEIRAEEAVTIMKKE